jgi:hypothetical protein
MSSFTLFDVSKGGMAGAGEGEEQDVEINKASGASHTDMRI